MRGRAGIGRRKNNNMRGRCALLTSEKISIRTASDPDDQSVLDYNLKIKEYYCIFVWIEVISFFFKI